MSVRWVGGQRDVLGGDVEGPIDLRSLTQEPHLYALGPRARVPGEITVYVGLTPRCPIPPSACSRIPG